MHVEDVRSGTSSFYVYYGGFEPGKPTCILGATLNEGTNMCESSPTTASLSCSPLLIPYG